MEKLIDIKRASELLNLSKYTLYRLTSLKKIPHVKIGGKIAFQEKKLEAFIESHCIEDGER